MGTKANLILTIATALAGSDGLADRELRAARVDTLPAIDGHADDAAWAAAESIVVQDAVAEIDIALKAVHDGTQIAFLVRYPDASEDREHKTMIWDTALGRYKTGPKREDVFVFKWNMDPILVDLTLSSETPYQADIWYWKAHRTDHAGYADDKTQLYVNDPLPHAKRLISGNGNLFYLVRSGDAGEAAYKALVHLDYIGEEVPRFELRTPQGSRADIKAKGQWENGFWTIEFSRRLKTGHPDDVALDPRRSYRFGVSRYEIAGRKPDPRLEQPEFGSGEIGERIRLKFD